MKAREIMDMKFEKGFNGYKQEDVDQYLQEISIEFSELQTQNENLEKKLEVLADKIREYREDEDAIKEALLGAQKQSASVISAANEKAENLMNEAKETAERTLKAAEEELAKMRDEGKRIIEEANAEKARIEREASENYDETVMKMELEVEREEKIIANLHKESDEFCNRLLTAYKLHIELIKDIPDKCQNEMIHEISKKVSQRKAEQAVTEDEFEEADETFEEEIVEAEEPEEEKIEEESEQEQEEKSFDEETVITKTSEIAFEPVFEEANEAEESESEPEETKDDESSPFYKKEKRGSKYEKLEFGKNK